VRNDTVHTLFIHITHAVPLRAKSEAPAVATRKDGLMGLRNVMMVS